MRVGLCERAIPHTPMRNAKVVVLLILSSLFLTAEQRIPVKVKRVKKKIKQR